MGKQNFFTENAINIAIIFNKRHVLSRKELMGCHKAFLIDNWASKGHVIRRKELIWGNKAFFMENLASKLACNWQKRDHMR